MRNYECSGRYGQTGELEHTHPCARPLDELDTSGDVGRLHRAAS